MSKSRKVIDFDLRVADLKRVFGEKSYTVAYSKIESYLESKGFMHDQGSGYISQKAMTNYEIYKIVESFHEGLPWFEECVDDFRLASIGRQYDAKQMLLDYADSLSDDVLELNEASENELEEEEMFVMGMR